MLRFLDPGIDHGPSPEATSWDRTLLRFLDPGFESCETLKRHSWDRYASSLLLPFLDRRLMSAGLFIPSVHLRGRASRFNGSEVVDYPVRMPGSLWNHP